MTSTGLVGKRAEDLAAGHLLRNSMRILHRNLRFGRLGEIDIVAEQNGILVIVDGWLTEPALPVLPRRRAHDEECLQADPVRSFSRPLRRRRGTGRSGGAPGR